MLLDFFPKAASPYEAHWSEKDCNKEMNATSYRFLAWGLTQEDIAFLEAITESCAYELPAWETLSSAEEPPLLTDGTNPLLVGRDARDLLPAWAEQRWRRGGVLPDTVLLIVSEPAIVETEEFRRSCDYAFAVVTWENPNRFIDALICPDIALAELAANDVSAAFVHALRQEGRSPFSVRPEEAIFGDTAWNAPASPIRRRLSESPDFRRCFQSVLRDRMEFQSVLFPEPMSVLSIPLRRLREWGNSWPRRYSALAELLHGLAGATPQPQLRLRSQATLGNDARADDEISPLLAAEPEDDPAALRDALRQGVSYADPAHTLVLELSGDLQSLALGSLTDGARAIDEFEILLRRDDGSLRWAGAGRAGRVEIPIETLVEVLREGSATLEVVERAAATGDAGEAR